ncbi:MAG: ABC transporter permease [Holosporales bacterium]|jgi:ABC-2 type transport system permease protein|nr:ABC transporter permease [Holosporales bacterium]
MILRGFIKKEIIQTLRDPRLGVMVLIMPVLQILLFGYALTNDVINIKLGGYFQPSDVVAQDIYKAAVASQWFLPIDVAGTPPEQAILSGKVDAVIIAPEGGVTKTVGRNEGKMQLLVNATNVLRAVAIDGYIQNIAWKVCSADGGRQSPVNVVMRSLYNPTLETSTFIVPGLMAMILTVLVMILTCTSIAKEKESGTFETIISAPIKRRSIILGKTIPFALVGLFNTFVVLIAGLCFFDLPFRGSFLIFLVENLFFVVCAVLLGILMSTFVKNQQQAMLCSFIVIFVLMMLSGSFFPIDNIPIWLRWFAYANPMAHHTLLIRNILLKGGDIAYVVQHCLAILAATSVIALCAFSRFRITLN